MQNIVVFGLQRSGTTYIHNVIEQYLRLKYGDHYILDIPEFFDLDRLPDYDANHHEFFYKKNEARIRKDITKYNSSSPILTKLHASRMYEMSTETQNYIIGYLNGTAKLILTERNDPIEIAISLKLARETKIWNSTEQIGDIPQIEVPERLLLDVMCWQHFYRRVKTSFSNVAKVVNYNDIGNPNILTELGFDDPNIIAQIDTSLLPVKLVTKEEKMKHVKNLEEVKNWYSLYKPSSSNG